MAWSRSMQMPSVREWPNLVEFKRPTARMSQRARQSPFVSATTSAARQRIS
jgi:hypothetical protein